MNASWHKTHPMPRNPTLEQRTAWHVEHAQACGCRPVPPRVAEEMRALRARRPKIAATARRRPG